jgi:hypothetical protein
MALPSTDLEIVNLALDNLSHTIPVGNLSTDTSPEAKAAKRWLDADRDRALGAYTWRWAERWELLVEAAGQSHPEWAYFYDVPTGMVPGTGRFQEADELFEIVLNAAGTGYVVACNVELSSDTPMFGYTARITNAALYPQEFVVFFSWLLASDLAKPVLKDKDGRIRLSCLQEAALALAEAKAADLSGAPEVPAPSTPSVASRGGQARVTSSGGSGGGGGGSGNYLY